MIKKIKLILLTISIAWSHIALAQQKPPEITSATPSLSINFPTTGSFIHFFNIGNGESKGIEVHIYSPSKDGYKDVYVGNIGQEGGPPIIESVFLANADADPDKELFVLVRWEIRHPGIDTLGNYYEARIYDNKPSHQGNGLRRLTSLEERIGTGLDGVQEGRKVSFPYKDAASIRKLLQQIQQGDPPTSQDHPKSGS